MSIRFVLCIICARSLSVSDSAFPSCFPGARIDLSAEDNTVALALAECPSRPYAELIKSDIPGPSSLSSARSAEALGAHREGLSRWAFRRHSHQGRTFSSVGDAVSEAPEYETENLGLL